MRSRHLLLLVLLAIVFAAPSIALDLRRSQESKEAEHPERRGIGILDPNGQREIFGPGGGARNRQIDSAKSLFVNHPDRLTELSFRSILEVLAAQSGTHPEVLFEQWWGTLETGSNEAITAGDACPGEMVSTSPFPLNAYPMACDAELGALGRFPEAIDKFMIIGAVNRVDLTEPGQDCGEFRVIAALAPGWTPPTVIADLLVIFEGHVPDPGHDLKLCRAIQEFWALLSEKTDSEIATDLRQFFLAGGWLTGDGVLHEEDVAGGMRFDAALSVVNLGGSDEPRPGQIRVNSLTGAAQSWILREFEFVPTTPVAKLWPAPVAGTPHYSTIVNNDRELFDALIASYKAFTSPMIESFGLSTPPQLNDNQQVARPANPQPYGLPQNRSLMDGLLALMETDTKVIKKGLMQRFTRMTCAGCHEFANGFLHMGFEKHMPSQTFTHIRPKIDSSTGGYEMSLALTNVELPYRTYLMRLFIVDKPNGRLVLE